MRTAKQISNEITETEIELEKEIRALRRQFKARIEVLQKEMKQASQVAAVEARQQIMAILAEHHLTVESVFGAAAAKKPQAKKTRGPRLPPTRHYVGPDGQVWHGRGAHPAWLRGQDKKQFERPGAPPAQ